MSTRSSGLKVLGAYLTPRKLSLYASMMVCFVMLESPLILIANSIEPMLFGLPFFLVWNLFWWFVLTMTFLVAYLTNWGSPTP